MQKKKFTFYFVNLIPLPQTEFDFKFKFTYLSTLKSDNKSLMLSIGTPLYTRFPFKTRGGFGSLYETSNALVFATAQSIRCRGLRDAKVKGNFDR